MQIFDCKEKPIEIHGLPFFNQNGSFSRLPDDVAKAAPCAGSMNKYSVGARICFRTDSPTVYLKMKFKPLTYTLGMSPIAGQSLHLLWGSRQNLTYAGAWTPSSLDMTETSGLCPFCKKEGQEDVMVYLPRNAIVEEVQIGIEDGAKLMPPTPYKYPPMLYYGSSITAGGSCSAPFNAYNALISNRLDVDYYNFGFSGACMGELPIADCAAGLPISIFVYDYDHNAPNVEFLQKTHEPFFLRLREKRPDLPIIMMSKPDRFDLQPNEQERCEVIKTTYENALKRGDKNVYFIDGKTFFGETERFACTVDSLHPNDLGAYRMANVLEPIVAKILKERYPEIK